MFGPHLIIDGSKCNTEKLNDRLLIERILTDYPQAIGMTRIGGPYMFEYQAPDPAYSGVSGLVVIAESHIAIHTFPALDYFTMDIFSCKNFDHEVAIQYIRDALEVREMDRMLVQRGLSFRGPHHGPLGATDELIAAAAERHEGLGTTIGTIPLDDPLYPRSADVGQMLWPTYGVTPDVGSLATVSGGARQGAVVLPANAAAAGALGRAGLIPVQPVQLNPTASTSGVLDRLVTVGGQGRQLGKAVATWEQQARSGAPVILAIGSAVIANGMREVVTDLIHRGHVAAMVFTADALLADAYESLGYRHYLQEDAEDALPVRPQDEQAAALARLKELISGGTIRSLDALGQALSQHAPRPGIFTTAVAAGLPIATIGLTGLEALGKLPDSTALVRALLAEPAAMLVALGTPVGVLDALAAGTATTLAVDAALPAPTSTVRVDLSIALPLLATALVQRVPRCLPLAGRSAERELLAVR